MFNNEIFDELININSKFKYKNDINNWFKIENKFI